MAQMIFVDFAFEICRLFEPYENKIILERRTIANHFITPEILENLRINFEAVIIDPSMWMRSVLVKWSDRCSTIVTLGDLQQKFASIPGFEQFADLITDFILKHAKSWDDLDSNLKSKMLTSNVIFFGNEMQLGKLEKELSTGFNCRLKDHINQSVIQQVMQGKVLVFQNNTRGFLLQENRSENSPKFEIKYSTSQVLGTGSGNNQVFKGTFGKIPVAVKILPYYTHQREAENEIKILLDLKGHPNIVIYHASEVKSNQYLLALELCDEKTLSDWVKDPTCLKVKIGELEIVRQTSDGLAFLHDNQVIHRDLKPSNILFSVLNNCVFVKLADFGISRLLPQGKLSKTLTSYGGSNGWTAAEMLKARQLYNETGTWNSTNAPKLTKKIDIFSLGCIFYKVLSNGKHPFGLDETLLDHNILQGNIQTEENMESLRQRCNLSLINKMIAKNPDERPDLDFIKSHPIFWSEQKMIDFIQEVSNFVYKPQRRIKERVEKCVENFETKYFPMISSADSPEQGWLIKLEDTDFKNHKVFKPRFKSNKKTAMKLVRLIRNFSHHYHEEQNTDLKMFVGDKPKGFMRYWLKCFPTLINEMRVAFESLKDEETFKQYYTASENA